MFSNSMRTSATTTAAAARLSFPILIQQQPTSFVNYRHHLFLLLPLLPFVSPKSLVSPRGYSRLFKSPWEIAPDAGMDAVQRRLMFEDEW
ncbi:hypothetical protein CFP56_017913 [Quercus suber]|uniref:Uncharacterized protein n=1 Tax=Quercus suber TaxID=58331 RepID=A0AAW0KLL3_QUESU